MHVVVRFGGFDVFRGVFEGLRWGKLFVGHYRHLLLFFCDMVIFLNLVV